MIPAQWTKQISRVFYVIVALLPFASVPRANEAYALGEYLFLGIIIVAGLILTIVITSIAVAKSNPLPFTKRLAIVYGALSTLLIITIVSIHISANPNVTIWGGSAGIENSVWPTALAIIAALLYGWMFSELTETQRSSTLYTLATSVTLKSFLLIAVYILNNGFTEEITRLLNYHNHHTIAGIAIIVLCYHIWNKNMNIATVSALLINSVVLLIMANGALLLLGGGVILLGYVFMKLPTKNRQYSLITLLVVTVLLSVIQPLTSSQLQYDTSSYAQLDHLGTFSVSMRYWGENPSNLLLGGGVGNFYQASQEFRPTYLNYQPDWQNVPTTSASAFGQFAVELGVIFALILLAINIYTLNLVVDRWKKDQDNTLTVALGAIALSYILGSWSPLMLFILPLFLIGHFNFGHVYQVRPITSIVFPILTTAAVIILSLASVDSINPFRHFSSLNRAETYQHQAIIDISRNETRSAYANVVEASKLVPDKAKYNTLLARLSVTIGDIVVSRTDGAERRVEELFAQGVELIINTTNSLAPYSLSAWEARLEIYQLLEDKYTGTAEQIELSLKKLIVLSPNQPYYRYLLGILYQNNGNHDEAIRHLSDAIALKSDYEAALRARAKSYASIGENESSQQDIDTANEMAN